MGSLPASRKIQAVRRPGTSTKWWQITHCHGFRVPGIPRDPSIQMLPTLDPTLGYLDPLGICVALPALYGNIPSNQKGGAIKLHAKWVSGKVWGLVKSIPKP